MAIEHEVDELKKSMEKLTTHFTVMVDSHSEIKTVLTSLSNSMATLIEVQTNTQTNTKDTNLRHQT